jgi:hypothetical protein
MVSNLKSETARANGAKSRGPTTAEGKEKSSRNALKHGLTASSGNILLDSEDPDEFEEIFNKLLGIHEPARPAEKDLVEEMGVARWRIRRIRTIETGLLNAEILTQAANSDTPDPSVHLASAYRALSDDSRSLALASRYEARLQRTYDRAYKTLRELQQARKSEPPAQPHTMHVKWVDRNDEPDQNYNPSANAEVTNEQNPSSEPASAASPTEPRASASGPTPGIPNEPTVAANKDVKTDFSNRNAGPAPKPAAQPPSSNIPEVKSGNGVVTTPCEAP